MNKKKRCVEGTNLAINISIYSIPAAAWEQHSGHMADRIRPAAHRCDAAIAASRADDGPG
jgi:hypothetical protein